MSFCLPYICPLYFQSSLCNKCNIYTSTYLAIYIYNVCLQRSHSQIYVWHLIRFWISHLLCIVHREDLGRFTGVSYQGPNDSKVISDPLAINYWCPPYSVLPLLLLLLLTLGCQATITSILMRFRGNRVAEATNNGRRCKLVQFYIIRIAYLYEIKFYINSNNNNNNNNNNIHVYQTFLKVNTKYKFIRNINYIIVLQSRYLQHISFPLIYNTLRHIMVLYNIVSYHLPISRDTNGTHTNTRVMHA